LDQNEENSAQLFNASLIINLVFLFFFILLSQLLLYLPIINSENTSLCFILQLVPFFLFVTGLFYPVQIVLQRQKKFSFLAFGKIIQTSSISVLCLFFGFIGNYYGMIWGYFLGWVIYTITVYFLLFKSDFRLQKPNTILIKQLLIKWKEYPLFHSLPSLLNTLSLSVPIIILSSKFNQEQLGYYNLSKQILGIPAALLSSAVHQVFFQKITTTRLQVQYGVFKKSFAVLSAIALLMIITMVFCSEIIFTTLYGYQWLNAGKMAILLVFPAALYFVVNALISVFAGINKIKIFSVWQFLNFLAIFSLVFVPFQKVFTFIKTLVVIESFSYLILAGLMFYIFRTKSSILNNFSQT
jgi:O-antigen/teichoic acid export membrane protein